MLILNVFCIMLNILWAANLGYRNPMVAVPLILIACTIPATIQGIKKL